MAGASVAANFVRQGKKIIGIGRNYVDHANELNNLVPSQPILFLKPTTSYLTGPRPIEIPKGIICHHEVELGVIIGKKTRSIECGQAHEFVAGYTLSIDLTARNLQDDLKQKSLPWSIAKGFDTFCPIGRFIPSHQVQDPQSLKLWLKVNGQLRQNSSTEKMIFKIPELVSHCSKIMTLEEGDLILTGTPSGVAPIQPGDRVEVGLEQPGDQISQPTHHSASFTHQAHPSHVAERPNHRILDYLAFDVVHRQCGLGYSDLRP